MTIPLIPRQPLLQSQTENDISRLLAEVGERGKGKGKRA